MTLREKFDQFCCGAEVNETTADLIWDWLEDEVGATQEKLLTDLQNQRTQRLILERRVEILESELKKFLADGSS